MKESFFEPSGFTPDEYRGQLIKKYCNNDTDPYIETMINTIFLLQEISIVSNVNDYSSPRKIRKHQDWFNKTDTGKVELQLDVQTGISLVCKDNILILEERLNTFWEGFNSSVEEFYEDPINKFIHYGQKNLLQQELGEVYLPFFGEEEMYRMVYDMKIQESPVLLYNKLITLFHDVHNFLNNSFDPLNKNNIDSVVHVGCWLSGLDIKDRFKIFECIDNYYQ